jgi:hypothetical protein
MSAIITDQIRIINAKTFLDKVTNPIESYYVFVGLPNSSDYKSDWEVSPPSPKDSFEQFNTFWDTSIAFKRILNDDVNQCIRRTEWTSGIVYDMYQNDITRDKVASRSGATSLYSSNYYVVNSDFRVYICLQNGSDPENTQGRPSLDEPTFTDLEPKSAGDSGDGYIWKYLYTIKPSEIIKFDSTQYIPVPKDWSTNFDAAAVRENASSSGQLKIVKITNRGTNLGLPNVIYNRVPIVGDGINAEATVVVNNNSQVESVTISNGGSGYTWARLNLAAIGFPSSNDPPKFEVIIPPPGGHGSDIYRELGATNILLYSRLENDQQDPDFIVGNEIARIGIVANPLAFNTTELLTKDKASSVYAIKLSGDTSTITFNPDEKIYQTIGAATTAVGRVVAYDSVTGVIKYWQDKTNHGYTFTNTQSPNAPFGLTLNRFTSSPQTGGNLTIFNDLGESAEIDTSFGTLINPGVTTSINSRTYYLGQSFVEGLANPEIERYTGDMIYVDHRPPITRSQTQKEDVKIVIQF